MIQDNILFILFTIHYGLAFDLFIIYSAKKDIIVSMLYQSRATLQLLGYPLYKINYLFPSSQSTFILIGMSHPASQYIFHYHFNGSILSKSLISFCYTFATMINPQLLLFPVPTQNNLTIFDLKDASFRKIQYKFKYQSLSAATVAVFGQSDTFCIKEVSDSKIHKFNLQYYQVSLLDELQSFGSIECYSQFTPTLLKGNNNSLMIWYEVSCKAQLQFQSYDPRRMEKEKLKRHFCRLKDRSLGTVQPIKLIAIFRIWESDDIFYAAVFAMREASNITSQAIPVILRINNKDEIISSTAVTGILSPYLFSFHNLGRYYMLNTPILHMNTHHKNISIISHDSSQQIESHPIAKQCIVTIPDHTCETILTYNCQNEVVTKIDFKLSKIMQQKQVYLYFMLYLNEDFDDDLLHDALKLLEAI